MLNNNNYLRKIKVNNSNPISLNLNFDDISFMRIFKGHFKIEICLYQTEI